MPMYSFIAAKAGARKLNISLSRITAPLQYDSFCNSSQKLKPQNPNPQNMASYATVSAHAIDNFMDFIESGQLADATNRLCAAVNQAYSRGDDESRNTVVGMMKYLHTFYGDSVPNTYTRIRKSLGDRIGNATHHAVGALALFTKIDLEIINENIAEERRAKNLAEMAAQRTKEISETEKRFLEDAKKKEDAKKTEQLISSLPQLAAEKLVPQVDDSSKAKTDKLSDADPFAPDDTSSIHLKVGVTEKDVYAVDPFAGSDDQR